MKDKRVRFSDIVNSRPMNRVDVYVSRGFRDSEEHGFLSKELEYVLLQKGRHYY